MVYSTGTTNRIKSGSISVDPGNFSHLQINIINENITHQLSLGLYTFYLLWRHLHRLEIICTALWAKNDKQIH